VIVTGAAEHGWPYAKDTYKVRRSKFAPVRANCTLSNYSWPPDDTYFNSFIQGLLTSMRLPGSHHLHLDPKDCDPVKSSVLEFLSSNS
jgi:hypothetical protein